MHLSRKLAVILGIVFWTGLAAIMLAVLRGGVGTPSKAAASPLHQVVSYALRPPRVHEARVVGQPVGRADPIFRQDAQGRWIQVGHVAAPVPADQQRPAGGEANAQLVWYDRQRDVRGFRLESYRNRGSLEEVLQTMLPPEKRAALQRSLAAALQLHGDEIAAAFRPVVEQSLRESVPVLEDALRASIARHREEFETLGQRWEQQLLKEQIIPLVREEVLPTVQQHAEPLARDIGGDLWDRASLWRFGWRALYDKTPLPEQQLTRKEWDRFVQEEVLPVLESRSEQIVEAQKRILVDLARNPRLRKRIGDVFEQMIEDPQFQSLIRQVIREAVIDNRRLHEVWTRNWSSHQARAAVRLTGERLEPIVRDIGDELFGTKEEGVDPDFARVLRNQILGKDRRWIIAVPDPSQYTLSDPVIVIRPGRAPMPFPLVMLAAPPEQE